MDKPSVMPVVRKQSFHFFCYFHQRWFLSFLHLYFSLCSKWSTDECKDRGLRKRNVFVSGESQKKKRNIKRSVSEGEITGSIKERKK